ncbi:hypothetical protein [Nocardia carnea]|uniref:Uncharacterized protein n=1 Tax=Nocardia carnea TaxID=37328 RepID=A0ABW7TXM3_9NOCA|nr:hypothetical protein [Nocardia carnea]
MTDETEYRSLSFDALADRARNAGYRLIREHHMPPSWALLDAVDGEYLHTAATLEEIARHLDD